MSDVVNDDLQKRLANIIRRGVIVDVQNGKRPKAKVKIGEIVTTWLPVAQKYASKSKKSHDPVEIGDAATVFSEGGDLLNGRVYVDTNTGNNPAPEGTESQYIQEYGNGIKITVDTEANYLEIILPPGGKYKIVGDGELDGNIKITKSLVVVENITGNQVSDQFGSMGQIRITYNGHTHKENDSTTNPPNQQMSTKASKGEQ